MNSKTKILFLVFSLIAASTLAQAKGIPKIPFTGLAEKKLKVYAGPNENFEAISTLEKDSKILVLGHSYGWYRLELPQNSLVYINKMFVEREGEDKGKVKGNRVNIRAGPSASFTILSQLNEDERVTIVGEDKEWYKIKPPTGVSGWVKADEVTFFSAVGETKH